MAEIGRNIVFPIYNEDGSSFHNLVLHQSAYESVVMSLGDKITGDVYYIDNTLKTTGHEYIEYRDELRSDAVKYVLVSPPTIVKEGMVSDNSDLKGMTKYSFTFYHPMYMLNNMPFSDVAVVNTDARFRSENKTFSWIGNLFDFADKLNKNLENTEWVVMISNRVPTDVATQLSEVLSFDSNTIGDALQRGYETWDVPFIISTIRPDEAFYTIGKRFCILFGLPSNEVYASDADRQINKPFVFKYGKGLGLKNNSATPKNNKIVTRIAGYGSETNIPWGYPQIVWYGDQTWDYTIDNDPNNYHSYPIYDGVVGGRKVRLIKHPYTRTHLMPSVYHLTVFNRVSPYVGNGVHNPDYDPNTQLIDYYDALDPSIYPNTIIPTAPSYESHEFDIKPELGDESILSATPITNNLEEESEWKSDIDNDGNYVQSYFKIKLPVLSFDLYATASLTEEMKINMRSGACIGCTFNVQVDWDDYRANMYDADGNFQPYGEQRDYEKYPRSDQEEIEIIVQKDTSTFGVLMPNVYQYPKSGDKFVVLGISLPSTYITSAESRLDDAMKAYMLENNVHYFDYPLKFDEKFLLDNQNILTQIRNNTLIRFEYAGVEMQLYVKQIAIKFGQAPLPQYDITLTDDVDVVLNQIGQTQKDIGKINTLISSLQQNYDRNVWVEIANKLSKVNDDTALGKITLSKGFHSNDAGTFGDWLQDVSGAGIYQDENGSWHVESDFIHARKKLVAKELQIEEITHVGGQQLLTAAEMVCDYVVEHDDFYRCYFLKTAENGRKIFNKFVVGDQARMQSFNVDEWEDGVEHHATQQRYYWRLVVNTDATTTEDAADFNQDFDASFFRGSYLPENVSADDFHFIDLSKVDCDTYSDAPIAGDKIVQLGHRTDTARQNAIVIAGAGESSPYIDEYVGINSYSLEGKVATRIKPGDNRFEGLVHIQNGSTVDGKDLTQVLRNLEDKELNVQGLSTGNENLLLNTGFTGDFEFEEMSDYDDMTPDTQKYSSPLLHWDNANAVVKADADSASGFAVWLNDGYIRQAPTKELISGETYNVTFRASGTFINLSIGTFSQQIPLTGKLKRYTFRFTNTVDGYSIFSISNSVCRLMEIQLSCGNVANTDWLPSPNDNPKAIAYFQNIAYLTNAINNASTDILGGLILSQMIRVGNYRNRQMENETGGMSGIYVSNSSPFLWGGGTMEDAIYTVLKYARDPSYQPTEDELSKMAKFVVTHGGRAILNDIVLRGYIYALGGYFKGEINATSGQFNSKDNGNQIAINAGNGGIIMTGPSRAQDQPDYPPDPSAETVKLLGCEFVTDPDSLERAARLSLHSKTLGDIYITAGDGIIIQNKFSHTDEYGKWVVLNDDGIDLRWGRGHLKLSADGYIESFQINSLNDATFSGQLAVKEVDGVRYLILKDNDTE